MILTLITVTGIVSAVNIDNSEAKNLLVSEGDALMKKRELKSCEEAFTNYRQALSLAPDDAESGEVPADNK